MAFKNIKKNVRNGLVGNVVSGKNIEQSAVNTTENVILDVLEVTGGTYTLTPGNGKKYHIFLGLGTLDLNIPSVGVNIEILAIGGGGAGGGRLGGGGGGGGMVHLTNYTIPAGSHTITIGGGGTAVPVTYPNSASVKAPNTSIGSFIKAYGGGGGSADNGGSAAAGGSGGGGTGNGGDPVGFSGLNPSTPQPDIDLIAPGDGLTAPYSITQGYPGGSGGGSGGGGSGAIGVDGPTGTGGAGRSVLSFASTLFPVMPSPWKSAVTSSGYYAGGGGGSGYYPPAGAGGVGGGGAGSPNSPNTTPGVAGIDNTGGGGGAGAQNGGTSGAGGSGIVIISYPE